MPVDQFGRYVATHKTWDHVGNMIPDVETSEGDRPWGHFKPAAWLPVQWLDKYHEEYYVIMPGKILATDNQGRLVPGQYGVGDPNITYTATDIERGVVDVRTGALLAAGANLTPFAVSTVTDFMGTGQTMAVSKPLGVAPYGFMQWAGDGTDLDDGFNPLGYRRHNFNMQHQVAMLCDYVLELPLVPAKTTNEALVQDSHVANLVTFNALSKLPVALNTPPRTPFTFSEGVGVPGDVAARFAVQKANKADVKAFGDWHVNYTTGVVAVYSTAPIGATDYRLTYYQYADAPASVSKFASAVGNLKAGDFLKCDANSNWTLATPKTFGDAETDNFDTFADIMGQVLEVQSVQGYDALDKVRTAYASLDTSAAGSLPGTAGQMDQMPGSATGGVPDKVHYAGAADLVVRINLVSR